MNKQIMRAMSLLLAFAIMFTSIDVNVYAEELLEEAAVEVETENQSTEEIDDNNEETTDIIEERGDDAQEIVSESTNEKTISVWFFDAKNKKIATREYKVGQPFGTFEDAPKENGYTFVGWKDPYTQKILTAEDIVEEKYATYGLYEVRKPIVYTMTVNYVTNCELEIEPTVYQWTVEDKNNNKTLTYPEERGYMFRGWYTDAEFTSNSVSNMADIRKLNFDYDKTEYENTVYAKWDTVGKRVVYELHLEGGYYYHKNEISGDTLKWEVNYGETFGGGRMYHTLWRKFDLWDAKKPMERLSAWHMGSIDGPIITRDTIANTAIEKGDLYAEYEPEYSVNLILPNEIDGKKIAWTYNGEEDISSYERYVAGEEIRAIPEGTIQDYYFNYTYKFDGWYEHRTNNKIDIKNGQKYTWNRNLELEPRWEKIDYTINFDANGGVFASNSKASKTVHFGDEFGEFPTVTKDGSYFVGWYLGSNFAIKMEPFYKFDLIDANPDNAMTLTAKWYNPDSKELAKPEISIWGNDEHTSSNVLEANVSDRVYIRCAEANATVSYSLYYTDAKEVNDQTEYQLSETDKEYNVTFPLERAGTYKVAVFAKNGDKTSQAEAIVHVSEKDAESPLYDSKNANAFWVTYGDTIYDAKTVSVPYTGAAVKLAGYDIYYGKTKLVEGKDYKVTYKNNKAAAQYNSAKAPTVVFTAKGNYTGTVEKTFNITKNEDAKTLAAKNVIITLKTNEFTFDGTSKKPAVETVVYKDPKTKKTTSIADTEYTISWTNNVNASKKAQVIISFTGVNYCGTVTKNFTINPLDLADKSVVVNENTDVTSAQYKTSNKKMSPISSIQITDESKTEVLYTLKSSDYTTSIKRSVDAAGNRSEAVTIKAAKKSNFKGATTVTYQIAKQDISTAKVLPCISNQRGKFINSTKNAVVAPVWVNKTKNYLPAAYTVVDKYGDVLKVGVDYTVEYEVLQDGDTEFLPANDKTKYLTDSVVKMKIKAKTGSIYTGQIPEIEYRICGSCNLAYADGISVMLNDVVYANKPNNFAAKVRVVDNRTKATLKNGKDYTVTYIYSDDMFVDCKEKKKSSTELRSAGDVVQKKDIVPAGTVLTAVITGVGNYDSGEATIEKNFTVGYDIHSTKVTVANVTFGENGVAVKPAESDIKVTLKNETVNSSNYDITNFTNNTKAGKASFTLVGKGKYVGTKKVTYKIAAKSMLYNLEFKATAQTINVNGKAVELNPTGTTKALTSKNGTFKLPASSFKVDGKTYVFEGWYEDSTFTKRVGGKGTIYTPSINAGETATLYAKYEKVGK